MRGRQNRVRSVRNCVVYEYIIKRVNLILNERSLFENRHVTKVIFSRLKKYRVMRSMKNFNF